MVPIAVSVLLSLAPVKAQPAGSRAQAVEQAYAAAEVDFAARLDELGLVGSTLWVPEPPAR